MLTVISAGETVFLPSMMPLNRSESKIRSCKSSPAPTAHTRKQILRSRGHTIFRNGNLSVQKATINLQRSAVNVEPTMKSSPNLVLLVHSLHPPPPLFNQVKEEEDDHRSIDQHLYNQPRQNRQKIQNRFIQLRLQMSTPLILTSSLKFLLHQLHPN